MPEVEVEQCDWVCPKCGGRCGGYKGHIEHGGGVHECPTHYIPVVKGIPHCGVCGSPWASFALREKVCAICGAPWPKVSSVAGGASA